MVASSLTKFVKKISHTFSLTKVVRSQVTKTFVLGFIWRRQDSNTTATTSIVLEFTSASPPPLPPPSPPAPLRSPMLHAELTVSRQSSYTPPFALVYQTTPEKKIYYYQLPYPWPPPPPPPSQSMVPEQSLPQPPPTYFQQSTRKKVGISPSLVRQCNRSSTSRNEAL